MKRAWGIVTIGDLTRLARVLAATRYGDEAYLDLRVVMAAQLPEDQARGRVRLLLEGETLPATERWDPLPELNLYASHTID